MGGAAAAGLAGVSTGLKIYGGILAANAEKAEGAASRHYYNFMAEQNEGDAKSVLVEAGRRVSLVQDAAGRSAAQLRRGVRRVEGTQKAAIAANGLGLDSITAEDILRDTGNRERMDEAAIRLNADLESREIRLGAADEAHRLRTSAIFNRLAGVNAYSAGRTRARTSLLSTATSVANTGATYAGFGAGGAG